MMLAGARRGRAGILRHPVTRRATLVGPLFLSLSTARADMARGDEAADGGAIPLAAAVGRVSARYEGRLLDARLAPGRPPEGVALVYELRWLTPAGDVIRIRLDAASGALIEVDGPGQFAARKAPPAQGPRP